MFLQLHLLCCSQLLPEQLLRHWIRTGHAYVFSAFAHAPPDRSCRSSHLGGPITCPLFGLSIPLLYLNNNSLSGTIPPCVVQAANLTEVGARSLCGCGLFMLLAARTESRDMPRLRPAHTSLGRWLWESSYTSAFGAALSSCKGG